MIANMNANNGKRLLAAVAIFAMLACVFAVAVPVDAEPSESAVTFDGENSFTDAGSPADSGAKTVSNAGLGNTIEYTYDAETKTYTLTGVLNKQDIAWDAKDNKLVGTNLTDSAQGGYGQHWKYADTAQYYWLFLELNSSGTITNAEGNASASDTDFILFLTEETKDIVRTITIGSDEYKLDMSGLEVSGVTMASETLAINEKTSLALPEGVYASMNGTAITIYGTVTPAEDRTTCEGISDFENVFNLNDEATGYNFLQFNFTEAPGVDIVQKNSALKVFFDEYGATNGVSYNETTGVYTKTSPTYKTQYYAFLIPADKSDVSVAVGTTTYNFSFETQSEATVDAVTNIDAYFEANDTVIIKDNSILSGTTVEVSMPDVEGKTLVIGDSTSGVSFTLNYGEEKVATIDGLKGTGITISHGSIILNGDEIYGKITVNSEDLVINTLEIPKGETLTVEIGDGYQATIAKSVAVNGNIVFNALGETASVLVQENVVLDLGNDSKITVGANVRMNNYGSINDGTVEVKADGTFYSATPVNTTFIGDGNIDLSDAMETLKISDKLASSAILKPTQNVLVNGNLTINAGEYLVVTGSLEVQEGVTVTINEGGLLMVYGPAASADIQGAIVSKGKYSVDAGIDGIVDANGDKIQNLAGFTYYNGKSIDISGTVTAKKATNDDVRTVWINGDSEISGTVTIDSKAKAEFGGETKIVEGGVLNINGTYAGTILNQGTVNLNGSVSAGAVVSMNSTAAVLNVTALKGDNSLIVNDNGLYLQTDDDGDRIIVGETAGKTMNAITLKNVKGVTITEGYTYTTNDDGDRIVHNNLYIAGTLNAQDSKDKKYGTMTVTGGVLTVSGELTIAKVAVEIQNGAEMYVTGTVYVTENDDYTFNGAGELTVTGLVRTVEDITDVVAKINAVKYEQTIENVPYYFYTSLAAAIASGEENLTVLGDLYILEDTTIPAGITVDASENNVFVGDDSRDITDITLTVANGGLLMAQKITVDATMMIENTDTGIDCNSIISDVSSTTETTAKYTNIYTALNEAQSGETVTITKSGQTEKGVVSIVRDVEIKDGVTLVVPAVNKLAISEGVTLTNNGTLDLRGSIIAVDADDDNVARFGTETVDDDGNEYAVIANNGTIVSVSKMEYGVENTSGYNIPGAYYTINGKFYITPVEDAAAQIGNTETDSIVIYGKNTVGTVAFVGTVEEPVKVTIDATAEITADSMTVTNGTIVANGGTTEAGAELNGTYGGSTGTVVLANMTVPTGATFTIEDKAVTVSEQTSQVTYVYGKLNAIISNDSVDEEELNKQIVSSVAFEGAVTVQKALDIVMTKDFGVSNKDTVTVNGTLTIAGTDAKVDVDYVPMVIDGNVIVDNAGKLVGDVSVLGNLDVKDKTDKTAAGTTEIVKLMIGAADYKYGTDVAASVSGAFSAKTVYVFSKAVLDDAAAAVVGDATVKSTEFYVEDALWMTVYDVDSATTTPIQKYDKTLSWNIAPSDLTNSIFDGWQVLEDGKYVLVNDKTINVGDYTAVYAYIDYEIYTVTVFADPGIDAVYVDGKLMTSGVFQSGYDGMWNEGFRLSVAAGTHEITYKLGNYFSGEANMTVNGESVTGNSFTTSGTDPEDTQVTIYLQGIEASAPETPSTGGDDGMGLTDYLLIILVILIVVMAIMVAMRLICSRVERAQPTET